MCAMRVCMGAAISLSARTISGSGTVRAAQALSCAALVDSWGRIVEVQPIRLASLPEMSDDASSAMVRKSSSQVGMSSMSA